MASSETETEETTGKEVFLGMGFLTVSQIISYLQGGSSQDDLRRQRNDIQFNSQRRRQAYVQQHRRRTQIKTVNMPARRSSFYPRIDFVGFDVLRIQRHKTTKKRRA
ncbi:hypothetical protein MUP77_19645 [Candidatus Bathyarchaeota archaeon]|nr:hypothetical protein [Candidatus Bathyarchaeota archaeon]